MKIRFAAVLVQLLVAVVCFGSELTLMPIAAPPSAPLTVGDAVRAVRTQRPVAKSPQSNVILLESTDEAFIIPVAGNAPGSNGTYFRTDLALVNDRSTEQNIGVGWMAQGVDNTNAGIAYYSLPANTFVAIDDFVGGVLQKQGLGALFIFGVTASGATDTAAQIDGYSRIWTPQPGSKGTVSQSFPAVSLTDSIGSLVANLVGLKQNAQFRTNIGVVNLDSIAHTWTARAAGSGVVTMITVPPFSMAQVPLAPNSAGTSSGNVGLELKSDGFGFWWSAYGSSTDNYTGDGWVSRATQ